MSIRRVTAETIFRAGDFVLPDPILRDMIVGRPKVVVSSTAKSVLVKEPMYEDRKPFTLRKTSILYVADNERKANRAFEIGKKCSRAIEDLRVACRNDIEALVEKLAATETDPRD